MTTAIPRLDVVRAFQLMVGRDRRWSSGVWRALAVLAVLGLVTFTAVDALHRPAATSFWDAPYPQSSVATVTEGPLALVITRQGPLRCAQETVLQSKVEWSTNLMYIAPEGTEVHAGDVVAELDVSKLREEYGEEQVDVLRAEAALEAAQKSVDIQEIVSTSELAKVRSRAELAALALEAYREAEFPAELQRLESQRASAADAAATASDRVAFTERQVSKGLASSVELEGLRIALHRAEAALNKAVEQLRILKDFSLNRRMTELEGARAEAVRSLERQTVLAEAQRIARKMEVDVAERRLLRQREQFAWATKMLENCQIKAPHSGQVVYATHGDSRDEQIYQGMMVRFLQPLVVIPDRSQMQVAVRVHESLRSHLDVGTPAQVHVGARGAAPLEAYVKSISSVPLTGRFPNFDFREYEVLVNVEDECHDLVPGLTTTVDLIADSRACTLKAPIEAFLERAGQCVAFVHRQGAAPEARTVQLGLATDDAVEVLSGLNAGDQVVLSPSTMCRSAVDDWERSLSRTPSAASSASRVSATIRDEFAAE